MKHMLVKNSGLILLVIIYLRRIGNASSKITSPRGDDNLIHPYFEEEIFVLRPKENYTATLIFLHGYCDTGETMLHVLDYIRRPNMKVISPTANKFNCSPLPDIHIWYDHFLYIDGLEKYKLNVTNEYIHHLINQEISHGMPPERIIVGGYSQGAPIAIHAVHTFPKKLGGLITFAEWEDLKETAAESVGVNKNISHHEIDIFTEDYGWGKGPDYLKFRVYTGKEHVITQEELKKLRKFLDDHEKKYPLIEEEEHNNTDTKC